MYFKLFFKIIGSFLWLFFWIVIFVLLALVKIKITGDVNAFTSGYWTQGVKTFMFILVAFSLPLYFIWRDYWHRKRLIILSFLLVFGISGILSYFVTTNVLPRNFTKIPIPPGATEVEYSYRKDPFAGNDLSLYFFTSVSAEEIYDFYSSYLKSLGLQFIEKRETDYGEGLNYYFRCLNRDGGVKISVYKEQESRNSVNFLVNPRAYPGWPPDCSSL